MESARLMANPEEELSPVGRENRDFYDGLYGGYGAVTFLLRGRLSFDQQSKARPNEWLVTSCLASRFQLPMEILDYGSGWGTLLFRLRRRQHRLFALDLSTAAIDGAKRSATLIGHKVHDPRVDRAGRLCPQQFDLITCSHVLEHVPDDDALLAEFVGALRPGGYLLLNVPINEVAADPKHVRSYTAEGLARLVARHGLDLLGERSCDRWSAYLLTHGPRCRRPGRVALRSLRAVLALIPWALVDWLDDLLLGRSYKFQQLLVLARKQG
jgi:2-polyprenyl-3-methyl-5-hydroxy-6-metoxy-1,4-benzoquinol methylase